ncbi:hypothetical protein OG559_12700 [Micromonospora sp. NBC_01405]|uniref:hypothetical protein n=1 Tax=Micromonospora sp. NBC_01405 TaxID=2903589 RepID=UPI003248ABA7
MSATFLRTFLPRHDPQSTTGTSDQREDSSDSGCSGVAMLADTNGSISTWYRSAVKRSRFKMPRAVITVPLIALEHSSGWWASSSSARGRKLASTVLRISEFLCRRNHGCVAGVAPALLPQIEGTIDYSGRRLRRHQRKPIVAATMSGDRVVLGRFRPLEGPFASKIYQFRGRAASREPPAAGWARKIRSIVTAVQTRTMSGVRRGPPAQGAALKQCGRRFHA